jgi:hypothetical protein
VGIAAAAAATAVLLVVPEMVLTAGCTAQSSRQPLAISFIMNGNISVLILTMECNG